MSLIKGTSMKDHFELSKFSITQHTREDRKRYRAMFAKCGIEINDIVSWAAHRAAVEYCVSRAINELKPSIISDLDVEILKDIVSPPGNKRTTWLARGKDARGSRGAIRLVYSK